MFLYNSVLLLYSAVSTHQTQHGWAGRGLCPVPEACGLWWERESRARLVLSLPLCHCSGDSAHPVLPPPLSALGVTGEVPGGGRVGGYHCTPHPAWKMRQLGKKTVWGFEPEKLN